MIPSGQPASHKRRRCASVDSALSPRRTFSPVLARRCFGLRKTSSQPNQNSLNRRLRLHGTQQPSPIAGDVLTNLFMIGFRVTRGLLEESSSHLATSLRSGNLVCPQCSHRQTSRKHSRHTAVVTREVCLEEGNLRIKSAGLAWQCSWRNCTDRCNAFAKSERRIAKRDYPTVCRTGCRFTSLPGGSCFPSRSSDSIVARTTLITCSIPWSEFSIR